MDHPRSASRVRSFWISAYPSTSGSPMSPTRMSGCHCSTCSNASSALAADMTSAPEDRSTMRMSSRASASSSTTRTRRPLRTAGLTISRSSLRSTGIAACYIILGVATLIGCVAALWFFWDKIAPRLRRIPPPSPAASTGVSAHDRALIGNAMQELETNAQLLATPQYYTAPALRDDAWRQLQPGVAVPGGFTSAPPRYLWRHQESERHSPPHSGGDRRYHARTHRYKATSRKGESSYPASRQWVACAYPIGLQVLRWRGGKVRQAGVELGAEND